MGAVLTDIYNEFPFFDALISVLYVSDLNNQTKIEMKNI